MSFRKALLSIFSIVLIAAILVFLVYRYYFKQLPYGAFVYDLLNKNEVIYKYEEAKKILTPYPKIKQRDLPLAIRSSFQAKLEGNFYEIPYNDVYKKICLNSRINTFLSKENQLSRYSFIKEQKVYVYINEELLRSFFKLLEKLQSLNYNSSGIVITSAFRSSIRNDRVGGAPQSQHLKGKAFDLQIGDINNDGKANQVDKKIVYDILDQEIIKYKGGLGFYPGTMIIHMDVRGKRARWNNYSR